MFDYRFVKINVKTTFGGVKPDKDYHEIVDEYASLGWRLVQIFTPPTSGPGLAEYFELIFEKERNSTTQTNYLS